MGAHPKEGQNVSQSDAIGDEQGKQKKSNHDYCSKPGSIIEAVNLLTDDEKKRVKESGFGALLDLKLKNNCVPQMAVDMMEVSELQEDHIAIKVLPDVTLNLDADVLEKVTKAPRGSSMLENFTGQQRNIEYKKLREKLGVPKDTPLKVSMLLEKLRGPKEDSDQDFRLRIFYLIVICCFLRPSEQYQADSIAVWCTRDINKIADFDWCVIMYEQLREVISTKSYENRTVRGCITALLVYFLDNFTTNKEPTIDENKDETLDQDKEDIATINQYNDHLVMEKSKNIKFKNGMFEYKDLQLKNRKCTCYGESSITQISTLESEVPAGVQNEERVVNLEKLLLEAGQFVPPHLKEEIRAVVRPQVGTNTAKMNHRYGKRVLSKIGSCDKKKPVFSINEFRMSEEAFVEAFKPEGHMNSEAGKRRRTADQEELCDDETLLAYEKKQRLKKNKANGQQLEQKKKGKAAAAKAKEDKANAQQQEQEKEKGKAAAAKANEDKANAQQEEEPRRPKRDQKVEEGYNSKQGFHSSSTPAAAPCSSTPEPARPTDKVLTDTKTSDEESKGDNNTPKDGGPPPLPLQEHSKQGGAPSSLTAPPSSPTSAAAPCSSTSDEETKGSELVHPTDTQTSGEDSEGSKQSSPERVQDVEKNPSPPEIEQGGEKKRQRKRQKARSNNSSEGILSPVLDKRVSSLNPEFKSLRKLQNTKYTSVDFNNEIYKHILNNNERELLSVGQTTMTGDQLAKYVNEGDNGDEVLRAFITCFNCDQKDYNTAVIPPHAVSVEDKLSKVDDAAGLVEEIKAVIEVDDAARLVEEIKAVIQGNKIKNSRTHV